MPTNPANHPINRVLVLGAYGFIGSAVVRRLRADGFHVTGLGRNLETARKVLPDIEWVICDLDALTDPDAWRNRLENIDAVVNCAGALQDGANDNLSILHERAIAALADACTASGIALVQISAVGVTDNATTKFMRSKAVGDASIRNAGIRNAGIPYWIFRPGLVLGQSAYGGTLLLRALAAVPVLQPIASPQSKIQTLALTDLTKTVSAALTGQIPPDTTYDLVEDEAHSLSELVAALRNWLGFSPARTEIVVPTWTMSLVSRGADLLGALGWRSPLRHSAVMALSEDIDGDPKPFRKLGLFKLSSLQETLSAMPAFAEDRLHARLALLQPFILAVLFALWFGSGLVGFLSLSDAAEILTSRGWPHGLGLASVVFWSLIDIAIAAALLVRKFAARACLAMVAVSLLYLLFATAFAPGLWLDPLGSLLKVLPGILLALVARATLETR